jgi:hypothetical protein
MMQSTPPNSSKNSRTVLEERGASGTRVRVAGAGTDVPVRGTGEVVPEPPAGCPEVNDAVSRRTSAPARPLLGRSALHVEHQSGAFSGESNENSRPQRGQLTRVISFPSGTSEIRRLQTGTVTFWGDWALNYMSESMQGKR